MFLSRLRLESDRKDFMYHILNSKGPAATPKELASHYNVIMMAGAVTTATFLSGVLYYLGHNRQALGRLQNELRSTFPSLADINSKNLLDCVYVNAVVEEGLRIYPPAGAAVSFERGSGLVERKGTTVKSGGHFVVPFSWLRGSCSALLAMLHSWNTVFLIY